MKHFLASLILASSAQAFFFGGGASSCGCSSAPACPTPPPAPVCAPPPPPACPPPPPCGGGYGSQLGNIGSSYSSSYAAAPQGGNYGPALGGNYGPAQGASYGPAEPQGGNYGQAQGGSYGPAQTQGSDYAQQQYVPQEPQPQQYEPVAETYQAPQQQVVEPSYVGNGQNYKRNAAEDAVYDELSNVFNDPQVRIKRDNEATFDPKCNSEALRTLILDNIEETTADSKRKIQAAVSEEVGGRVDVICSAGTFSYIVNTEVYCETEKNGITCFAFKQSP